MRSAIISATALAVMFAAPGCSSSAGESGDFGSGTAQPAGDAGSSAQAEGGPTTRSTSDGGGSGGGGSATSGPYACSAGAKKGGASGQSGVPVTAGATMNVVTPPGYDPAVGSPLIVAYSGAGGSADYNEMWFGIGPNASSGGYVVAYVDHLDPATQLMDAAGVPAQVAAQWCIDPKRMYCLGHSDGGTMCEGSAINGLVDWAAIVASASGVNQSALQGVACPIKPLAELNMHSTGDELFPVSGGYGAYVASWVANCNRCQPAGAPTNGCVPYTGCSGIVEVLYCQGSAAHGYWPPSMDPPPTTSDIFDFIAHY